jgi:polysaccharide biosynthesis/export protein
MIMQFMRHAWLLAAGLGLFACSVAAAKAEEPPAASPPAVSAPLESTAPEYRIGPGDQLEIFVFNQPELSVKIPVRPDGLISSPLVENMQAAGRTPSELAREMEKRLAQFVRSPTVNVIVTNFVGTYDAQIRVVGQAANPQSLSYRAGMTLLDVMIAVGGLGKFAAGNRAKIVRKVDGKPDEIKVKLNRLLDGDVKFNVEMRPGDVLIIPESRF